MGLIFWVTVVGDSLMSRKSRVMRELRPLCGAGTVSPRLIRGERALTQLNAMSAFGWGHVAVSCKQQWKRFQDSLAWRPTDSFTSVHARNFDCSGWFRGAVSMTPAPSTLPRFANFGEIRGVPSTSHTI